MRDSKYTSSRDKVANCVAFRFFQLRSGVRVHQLSQVVQKFFQIYSYFASLYHEGLGHFVLFDVVLYRFVSPSFFLQGLEHRQLTLRPPSFGI
jgi:hypothetical protein